MPAAEADIGRHTVLRMGLPPWNRWVPTQAIGLRLHAVEVKDVMFPGELKKIFAEVVRAQKEGQAALERARGETAALRSLANAARMVQESPALMSLRVLQSVAGAAASGGTVVLGVPQGIVPVAQNRHE
jgi:regulator of protease activity HflC (stomatin/prohibitin superfamily)